MPDSFYSLCVKYDSVKTRLPFHYSIELVKDVYPMYFEPKRLEAKCVLEVGCFKGGALRALRDYFPEAHIVGVDIRSNKPSFNRITFIQGDQTDAAFLKRLGETYGPFDFVLEDGCHHFDAQRLSLEALFPFVAPGGYYFIEDVVHPYQADQHLIFDYVRNEVVNKDCLMRSNHWPFPETFKVKYPVSSVAFHRGLIAIQREK
jgi:SAM-dependent methyltransferase